MLFSSFEFLFIFLPAFIAIFWLVGKYSRTGVLVVGIAASLLFYGYYKPIYLPLLIGSVIINYFIGEYLRKKQNKKVLIAAIVSNLGLLAFFKYTDFAVKNLNLMGADIEQPGIALPLAISFFTFQQVAYVVDSYKGTTIRTNFTQYAFFVTFFPQLIAGPIIKQQDVAGELNEGKVGIETDRFALGISVFILGLFKKVAIADSMAAIADPIFNANAAGHTLEALMAWMGALAYTFQIYFDFSGYSDMAIGLGIMCGLHFPLNFNSPYKASSIIDFWRRWHITLSRFLRDYLYIPLGGNKAGVFGRYGNLTLTMLLGGLWHGADWAFVLWGGLHGTYLMLNHAYRNVFSNIAPELSTKLARWFGVPLTFFIVLLAWVPFRANGTDFMPYFSSMFTGTMGVETSSAIPFAAHSGYQWALILGAVLVTFLMPNISEFMGYKDWAAKKVGARENTPAFGLPILWSRSISWGIAIGFLALVSVAIVLRGAPNAFIYFEF